MLTASQEPREREALLLVLMRYVWSVLVSMVEKD